MIIQNEKFGTFTYTLFENSTEGNVIEEVTADNPMGIVFGQGKLIPFFEERLMGMTAGQDFEITVPSKEAFGERNPKAVYELSKETFRVNGVIDENLFTLGNKIPMRDRGGNVLDGYVKDQNETTVTLDFNHPLAGIDIVFKGNILDVREATFEELNPPSHGGCGCGSGGGSCSTDGQMQGESCGCSTEEVGASSCSTESHGHGHGGGCGCH
jgi:FKBP-type peptidyl-prolyl cis-trans isomerase SlyD